jgi:hypothetical protein
VKHTLKAPGAKRLKLKYVEPLSKFAFNDNLRRYTTGMREVKVHPWFDGLDWGRLLVRCCKFKPGNPC